jgi:uncharacterized protein (DUF433 family)
MRRLLAGAATAALLATGGVAVAGAADGGSGATGATDAPAASTTEPNGSATGGGALHVAAETIGVSVRDLRQALRDGDTIAEIARANDVDPQVVKDALAANAAARADRFVDETPARTGRAGPRVRMLRAAAKVIGVEPRDLVAQLRDGKSVAEVAQANDVEPQAVVDAIVAAGTERLERIAERFVTRDRDPNLRQ